MKRMIVFIVTLLMLFGVVPVISTIQVHAEGNTKGFLFGRNAMY